MIEHTVKVYADGTPVKVEITMQVWVVVVRDDDEHWDGDERVIGVAKDQAAAERMMDKYVIQSHRIDPSGVKWQQMARGPDGRVKWLRKLWYLMAEPYTVES
jgi:hypothetical protein